MRESRLSGSEGGARFNPLSLPLSKAHRLLRPAQAKPNVTLVSLWWRLAVQDTVSCSGKL